jgi:hypothetical protein
MINDSSQEVYIAESRRDSTRRSLLAVVCAFAITALLLAGYAYFRNRHAQQVLVSSAQSAEPETLPKGPTLAHVVVDEPLLEKGTTILKGTVKNTSNRSLSGLIVTLELRKRKESTLEEKSIPVLPSELKPGEEGAYVLKIPAQDYASIRLSGLRADPQFSMIAYSTSAGKKRPPEKVEPRTVIMRPAGKPGEFINTPDNPGRVP